MDIIINGEVVDLYKPEWQAAKEIVVKFFDTAKQTADEKESETFFFTLLIAAHMVSAELIEATSAETISAIMKNKHRAIREAERAIADYEIFKQNSGQGDKS